MNSEWTKTTAGTKKFPAWDHESGLFQIVDCRATGRDKPYRLIAFAHEDDDDDGNEKFWDFNSLASAMKYVEYI